MTITPRRATLAGWALAMALGLLAIVHARFTSDLSAFLPADPDPAQRVLVEQLRSGAAARTLMLGITGGDAAARADASRALAAALRATGAFTQVQNGERDGWQSAGALIVAHRYQLSPAMTPSHFGAAGLRDAIGDTLSLLGTPADAVVRPLLERDPTGETQRIAEALTPASAPRIDQGVWVSRTAPRALLLLTTRADGGDLDAQAAAIERVRAAFAPQQARGLQLAISGTAVFAVESRARIERQAALLGGAGLVLVGALLLAAFASLRTLAVAMLPVATGVVAGIAVTGLVFGTVHGLTLAFGSTLIGESVDYAIYFLVQADAGGWRRWRERQWPTVRAGLLTSVCGFAVLAASSFPGLAQLGVFSMAGLLAAALTTRTLLPALMPDGAPGRARRGRLGRVATGVVAATRGLRPLLLAFGCASLALVLVQGGRLWRGDLVSLSPVSATAQALDASLRADLGASDARLLVAAAGADRDAALLAAERAGAALDPLVDTGAIAGYDSPARWLPGAATQAARQAVIPDPATLEANLAEAVRGGPLTVDRLQPFLREAEAARTAAPLRADAFAGTAVQPVLDGLLMARPSGGWSALLPLQDGGQPPDARRIRAALAAVAKTGVDVRLVDIKQSLDTLYARYLRDALLQSLAGAAAVVVVIAWHLRSTRRTARVVGPLALAVLLTMGGLAAFGVALGILHLVGLLLVVAVGSNYGLFFDHAGADPKADAGTLASLLLANLTAVLAFALIGLSDLPALSSIGRVVAPGALMALVCCAAFSSPVRGTPPATAA